MAAEDAPEGGLALIDKPAGVTSHDVVDVARRAYRERSIGHLGTLDPFATGLLVLLVGRATRLATFITNEPKTYDATIRFGTETDTDDLTGSVTRSAPPPDPDRVLAALPALTGTLDQLPPAFSAKKLGGVVAHAAARAGQPLPLRPTRVTVHGWRPESCDGASLRAVIVCSGGTYIRSLARDLGRLTASAAHLAALRRLASGPFDVADATPLERLRSGSPPPVRRLRVVPE